MADEGSAIGLKRADARSETDDSMVQVQPYVANPQVVGKRGE